MDPGGSKRSEDERDGVRTKTDEDVELGVSQEQIGTEEFVFIDLPKPARPLSHVKTGRTSGLHHGTHLSLFLLQMCIIRANRASARCHIFLDKSSEQHHNFV